MNQYSNTKREPILFLNGRRFEFINHGQSVGPATNANPCPSCGSDRVNCIQVYSLKALWICQLACGNCGVRGPRCCGNSAKDRSGEIEMAAVAAWNKLAERQKKMTESLRAEL